MKENTKENDVWNQKGSIWKSESAYWNWIRGQLRRASSRYPIKNAFIRDNRHRLDGGYYKNGKKKTMWGGVCNECSGSFKMKELAVDHIEPAGSMNSPDQLEAYITRLFCSYDNFQFLCTTCHEIKTYQDIQKIRGVVIDKNDAVRGKAHAAMVKLKVTPLKKIMTQKGATEENMKNKAHRDAWLKAFHNIWW